MNVNITKASYCATPSTKINSEINIGISDVTAASDEMETNNKPLCRSEVPRISVAATSRRVISLLQEKKEKDEYWNTSLHYAAQYGDVKNIKLLIIEGDFDVDAQNKEGCSALLLAVMSGSVECVELLLSRSFNPNLCDIDGMASLHWAAYNNVGSDIIQALLRCPNIDIKARDRRGRTYVDILNERESSTLAKALAKTL